MTVPGPAGDKFMQMGRVGLGGIFAALMAMTAPAMAVPYFWVPLTASGEVNGNPVSPFSLGVIDFDAPVAGNHFSFQAQCFSGPACAPQYFSGDFGNVAIAANIPGKLFPIVGVNIDVIFNADGTLSGLVNYVDTGAHYFTSGAGSSWGGSFNSDLINCTNPNPCGATGYWQTSAVIPAPEPLTMSLFGVGFAGAVALRRRRIAK